MREVKSHILNQKESNKYLGILHLKLMHIDMKKIDDTQQKNVRQVTNLGTKNTKLLKLILGYEVTILSSKYK